MTGLVLGGLVLALVMAVAALLRSARRQGRSDAIEENDQYLSELARKASHVRDRLEHDRGYAERVRARFRR